ncbi:MAG: heavy metal translocating P-type ATPase [Anaerolineae bacterium]|jgi:Cu+-exporting ATPase|nr:copper-translocating P-type ATPase [Chloroflexota bacterium]
MSTQTVELDVLGMTCASCANTVERSLKRTAGVDSAHVNIATERATVSFDPQQVNIAGLVAKVRDAGYDAAMEKVLLPIGGMTCAACVRHVERALSRVNGVVDATVNLATERAAVQYLPHVTTVEALRQAVADAGYEVLQDKSADLVEDAPDLETLKMQGARRRMWIAWAFTGPIVVLMLLKMVFGVHWASMRMMELTLTALALPVLLWPGWPTFRSAWNAVRHGSANMDVLIALGTGASWLSGPLSLITPLASYGGVAAMIMAIHLTGRYIEASARGRASQAIRKLLQLGAKQATLLVDGQEYLVPLSQVRVGDLLLVRPGDKIPTDGLLEEGSSTVDESMATGESMPVTKSIGDNLIGGTINQGGLLHLRATRVGADTFLSQVIRMVEEAQGTRVPIQAFADRVTGVFVPAVIAIALLTAVLWLFAGGWLRGVLAAAQSVLPWVNPEASGLTLALAASISVLVVACPCALGLATPTALMVGSGIGAQNGILIRNGAAIQTLNGVQMVVFDKTGTLTVGRPQVTDVVTVEGEEREVLRLAAAAEQGSEHPLGQAVLREAQHRGIEVPAASGFEAIRGQGVLAEVEGATLRVGSRRLLTEAGIDLQPVEEELERLEGLARTTMVVAREGVVLGALAVADPIRPESARAIADLAQLGVQSAMLTGDNHQTAEAIAAQAGIDHVVAGVLPEGKVAEIRHLQEQFGSVAMVGDGINDAPALTQADVGIAIGTGTDIAIESADVTLLSGDLAGVVRAVRLGRATFRKIKQNLFWAFFYNVVMIPLAVFGLMHPALAELAMASSSISVVTNANLLRRSNIASSR